MIGWFRSTMADPVFERKNLKAVHPGLGSNLEHSLLANSAIGHAQAVDVLIDAHEECIRNSTLRAVNVWPSILLLMEQSIEMLLKTHLLYSQPSMRPRVFNHRLRDLVRSVVVSIPQLKRLEDDREAMDLICALEDSYNSLRYGEDWYSIKRSATTEVYRRIITTLRDEYVLRTGIQL